MNKDHGLPFHSTLAILSPTVIQGIGGPAEKSTDEPSDGPNLQSDNCSVVSKHNSNNDLKIPIYHSPPCLPMFVIDSLVFYCSSSHKDSNYLNLLLNSWHPRSITGDLLFLLMSIIRLWLVEGH